MYLFALTSRAGHRNQVFLVPDRSDAAQKYVEARAGEVTQAVGSAASSPALGDDFVVAWRDVPQVTTGRVGREWLCVSQVDVPRLAGPQRKALHEWLEARLGELDAIVTARDWQGSAELFEVIPQLGQWQHEARRTFAQVLRRGAAFSPATSGSRGAGRVRRRWLVGLSLGVLLAFVAATGAIPGIRQQLKSIFRRLGKGGDKPSDRAKPSDDDFCNYAKQLLGDNLPEDPNECKKRLADKLTKLYYFEVRETDPEKIIEYVLKRFEEDMGRKVVDVDIGTLIDSGPADDLKKLFPNGEFDPTGIMDWSIEDKKFWKDFTAYEVEKLLLEPFRTVHNEVGQWKLQQGTGPNWPLANDFEPLFNALGKFATDHPQPQLDLGSEGVFRCFYVDRDEKVLKGLRELLQELAWQPVVQANEEPQTARECIKALFKAFKSGKAKEAVDGCRKYASQLSEGPGKLFKLDELVRKWGESFGWR